MNKKTKTLLNKIKNKIFWKANILDFKVIEVNNIEEIKKNFGWTETPRIEREGIHDYQYVEDINERRIRDAEVLGAVVANINRKTILEIGTSTGVTTVYLAKNAPKSHVFTINIPAEDLYDGKGGINTTIALEAAEIGKEYKKLGLQNITQIYENTATWEPNIGEIDIAFIDGSHDTKFVFNDTVKVLKNMPSGSFIMWHDFNPALRKKFHWINDVCKGIELLYKKGYLTDRIFVLKDSWIGLYRVP